MTWNQPEWTREKPVLANYQAGSPGPEEADKLLKKSGHHWWEI